jgi:hypothetical protein
VAPSKKLAKGYVYEAVPVSVPVAAAPDPNEKPAKRLRKKRVADDISGASVVCALVAPIESNRHALRQSSSDLAFGDSDQRLSHTRY